MNNIKMEKLKEKEYPLYKIKKNRNERRRLFYKKNFNIN